MRLSRARAMQLGTIKQPSLAVFPALIVYEPLSTTRVVEGMVEVERIKELLPAESQQSLSSYVSTEHGTCRCR